MSMLVPPARPLGLAAAIAAGAGAASLVSLVLIVLLPGGAGSLDETLPMTGPLGQLISDIVPFVWVGLFGGLGAAYWLVSAGEASLGRAGQAILALIGLCMVYPVLASGVANPVISILGNIAVVLAALLTAALAQHRSTLAAVPPLLVAVWVTIATIGLMAVLRGWRF